MSADPIKNKKFVKEDLSSENISSKFRFPTESIMAFAIITVFGLLCFFSQRHQSVTVDEFCHFPSGIYNLVSHDWSMDHESPPLVKCFPALSVLITKPKLGKIKRENSPNSWAFGYEFMYRNHGNYIGIFSWARIAIIILGCLGGLLVYHFATSIFDRRAGLFALFLYAFNPNVLAHSSLTTIDTGATLFFLLAFYCFWRFVSNMVIREAVIFGFALGLALLSKFTALLLPAIFIIILALHQRMTARHLPPGEIDKREKWRETRVFLMFSVSIVISLLVVNAGYLFSESFLGLNKYEFSSGTLKLLASFIWPSMPVPFPREYIMGFDAQLAISAGNNPFYASYLMGNYSLEGWPQYYPVAFFVKNQEALTLFLILALFLWIKKGRWFDDQKALLTVLFPIAAFVLYFSLLNKVDLGIRAILPVFPLLFIFCGGLVQRGLFKRNAGKYLMIVLMLGYLFPTIRQYPHFLSYFNTVSGGSERGHKWLIDSNLDWGQDLPALREYMNKRGLKKIGLGYFGRVDPELYGIRYELSPQKPTHGIHVISINYLMGRPYYLLQPKPKVLHYIKGDYYKAYRGLEPVDVIGHTLYVFEFD